MKRQLKKIKHVALDMDGTIYIDDVLVPGARELLAHLDAHGCRYVFVTNNSFSLVAEQEQALAAIGIALVTACRIHHVA